MRGKRVNFFAARDDMSEIFADEELKFIPCGWHESSDIPIYSSFSEIPSVDINPTGSHLTVNFTVTNLVAPIKIVGQTFRDGSTGYEAKPEDNEAPALRFSPSGFTPDGKCFVHGVIDVLDGNEAAEKLFHKLRGNINKKFKNVNGWRIGANAEKYIGKVRFVTISSDSPQIYDLKLDVAQLDERAAGKR